MQDTVVQSLHWEDPLEKEMETHPSIVAWRIPWTEEPGRLQSMGSQRVRHDWVTITSLSVKILRLYLAFTETYSQTQNSTSGSWCKLQPLYTRASLVAQKVKNLPAMQDTQVPSLGWKIPWRMKWLSAPVFLPGEFHAQRRLVGYGPWVTKSGTQLNE